MRVRINEDLDEEDMQHTQGHTRLQYSTVKALRKDCMRYLGVNGKLIMKWVL